ncbi:hypothetical protein [Ottowia sp.]|uniref:hypothetical protein n=1 Tax=Ottowia sp. TaxID=1898956 RepID=UPI00260A41DC|nr:hypothetical protein [Ottowia sp.]
MSVNDTFQPATLAEAEQMIQELLAQREQLLDALYTALPFVEDAIHDPCYKPGRVKEVEREIRQVLESIESARTAQETAVDECAPQYTTNHQTTEPIEYRVQISKRGEALRDIREPFIVPTPVPYVVDLAHHRSAVGKEAMQASLIESCQALLDTLSMLGISLKAARAEEYTLNRLTRDRLLCIAIDQHNTAATERILQHRW